MSKRSFTFSLSERPGSPCWWATVYYEGEGGEKVRWSTRVPVGKKGTQQWANSRAVAMKVAEERAARDGELRRVDGVDVVYFISAGRFDAPVKIGTTSSLEDRIDQLQTSHHEILHVLGVLRGGKKREDEVHRLFAHLRMSGEWFKPGRELLAFIFAHAEEWRG